MQVIGVKVSILLIISVCLGFTNFQVASGQEETLRETVTRLSGEVEELQRQVQALEALLEQLDLGEPAKSSLDPSTSPSTGEETLSFNVEVNVAPPEESKGLGATINRVEFNGSEMRMLISLTGRCCSHIWPAPQQPEDIYLLDEQSNQHLFVKTTLPPGVNLLEIDVTNPYQFWIYFERPAVESGIYTFYYLGGTATFALTSENRVTDESTF